METLWIKICACLRSTNAAVLDLSRLSKQIILVVCDFFIVQFALATSIILQSNSAYFSVSDLNYWMFPAVGILGILINASVGTYKILIRSLETAEITLFAVSALLLVFAVWLIGNSYAPFLLTNPTLIFFGVLSFLFLGISRMLARRYYKFAVGIGSNTKKVLIFGTEEIALNIASALGASHDISLAGFEHWAPISEYQVAMRAECAARI